MPSQDRTRNEEGHGRIVEVRESLSKRYAFQLTPTVQLMLCVFIDFFNLVNMGQLGVRALAATLANMMRPKAKSETNYDWPMPYINSQEELGLCRCLLNTTQHTISIVAQDHSIQDRDVQCFFRYYCISHWFYYAEVVCGVGVSRQYL